MRPEPALHLSDAPLVVALAQVRFSEVLKMDSYVPDIQQFMRAEGLTRFSVEESQQIVFGPTMKTKASSRWVFSNRSQTEVVLIAPDFFVFQVSEYEKFEAFSSRMLSLLAGFAKVVGLEYSEQVGLRYLDLIRAKDELSVNDMICPSLRGLSSSQLGVKRSTHQFIVQAETDHGILMLRSFENNDGQFIPPDLQTPHLKFKNELSEGEEFRVLDFDHIARKDFDIMGSSLQELMWQLHEGINRAFRNSVTQEALNAWSGKNAKSST